MSRAIYPGTFDPLTLGHLSIIHNGLLAFDKLTVAVLNNPKKEPLFSLEERVEMLREVLGNESRIEIDSFDGLLVDYARSKGVHVVLRGLRAVSDFEYELQMANMNRHLDDQLVTVFIMAQDAYFYVSSNLIKEAAILGADISKLTPESVAKRLRAKLKR